MKQQDKDIRRSFIKHVAVGTGAVIGITTIARSVKPAKASTLNSSVETLYQQSEDFKKYYNTLRS